MEMEEVKIWNITLLLAAIAGFCDTVTFVAADSLFSAHVTGNFIVFAYQLINRQELHAWVKLLTFPVFVFSVMAGGRLAANTLNKYHLLLAEGVLLCLGGIGVVVFDAVAFNEAWAMHLIAMMVVFAMGVQNAFGKLYSKETYGPTTMMTGNVTQAALDLGAWLKGDKPALTSLKKQAVTIGGFLTGCVLGALIGNYIGLSAILLPGIGMVICYLFKS